MAYPYFLRMSPTELFQVNATIELMKYFGWKKVGTLGKKFFQCEFVKFFPPTGNIFFTPQKMG